ncbi:MAG: hypothetical protein EZS28_039134 [Streblomastix strix]|uniref:PPM-type phosphatase domain-containing protein n=1 Tax=Streblomastix strix TaxID=222440 RepID=A0A5J4U4R1_9EUKA|nr:MAG: hypothetical protein EZS28_039134 [Streblomastix strix]
MNEQNIIDDDSDTIDNYNDIPHHLAKYTKPIIHKQTSTTPNPIIPQKLKQSIIQSSGQGSGSNSRQRSGSGGNQRQGSGSRGRNERIPGGERQSERGGGRDGRDGDNNNNNNNNRDNNNRDNRTPSPQQSTLRGSVAKRDHSPTPQNQPTLRIHNCAVAESCGVRPTMEDAVLIIPCGGWDISALIEAGEMGILQRLLRYPQELRFTIKGWNAFERREEKIWKERVERDRKLIHPVNLPEKCPYKSEELRGCGIFAIFDGHRGPHTANYLSANYVDSFLLAAYSRYRRIEEAQLAIDMDNFHSNSDTFETSIRLSDLNSPSQSNQRIQSPASKLYSPLMLKNSKVFDSAPTLPGIEDPLRPHLPVLSLVLRDTFEHLIAKMQILSVTDGSCAVVAAITPGQIYMANIGDCRGVLVSRFTHSSALAQPIQPIQKHSLSLQLTPHP